MARTRTTRAAEPVTVNVIDEIVAKLNELSGIEFAKDAWVNKAPENYGVVELSGESTQLWADGNLTDSAWRAVVHAYVGDGDDSWPDRIQGKLNELEAAGKVDLTHTCNREFDFATGKVRWQWIIILYGPLTRTETGA